MKNTKDELTELQDLKGRKVYMKFGYNPEKVGALDAGLVEYVKKNPDSKPVANALLFQTQVLDQTLRWFNSSTEHKDPQNRGKTVYSYQENNKVQKDQN